MDIINHQGNGANALRIMASAFNILGWIAIVAGIIIGLVKASEIIFIVPIGIGVISWAAMYLSACIIRGFAIIIDASQLYLDRNTNTDEKEI